MSNNDHQRFIGILWGTLIILFSIRVILRFYSATTTANILSIQSEILCHIWMIIPFRKCLVTMISSPIYQCHAGLTTYHPWLLTSYQL